MWVREPETRHESTASVEEFVYSTHAIALQIEKRIPPEVPLDGRFLHGEWRRGYYAIILAGAWKEYNKE